MKLPDPKGIFTIAKKYRKRFESTSVNLDAYFHDNKLYYLAIFENKYTGKFKGNTVISKDSVNKSEIINALKMLSYYSVTVNNIKDSIEARATMNFIIMEELRDYLRNILLTNNLQSDIDIEVYDRQFSILNKVIDLQKEMETLWDEVQEVLAKVDSRNYFTNQDVDTVISYIPVGHWIQYEQFKLQYLHKEDFDLIYENRNNPNLKRYERFTDPNTLSEMRSKIAGPQLEKSMNILTHGKDFLNKSKEEYINYLTNYYDKSLKKRHSLDLEKFRYPKNIN